MRWALVNSENIVENVVVWNGADDLFPATTNIQLQDDEACGPDWIYDSNSATRFSPPAEPQ